MIGWCRIPLFLVLNLATASLSWADVTPEQRGIVEQWIKSAATARTVQGEFEQIRYLKGVSKPLIRQGRIWLQKPGSFRWQIGDPPSMTAVRGADDRLTVLDAREKKARIWTHEALMKQEAAGGGQGIAMLGSGLADTMAEFEKHFEIVDVESVKELPGDFAFTLRLRDRTATVFVKSIVLTANTKDGGLRSFVIHMRDGSRMETVVRKYSLNASISPSIFKADTAGYEIEEVKPQ